MLTLTALFGAIKERFLRAAKPRTWFAILLVCTGLVLGGTGVVIYEAGKDSASSSTGYNASSSDYSSSNTDYAGSSYSWRAQNWREMAASYGYPSSQAYAATDAEIDEWSINACSDVANFSEPSLASHYVATSTHSLTYNQVATGINAAVAVYCPSYTSYVYWPY